MMMLASGRVNPLASSTSTGKRAIGQRRFHSAAFCGSSILHGANGVPAS